LVQPNRRGALPTGKWDKKGGTTEGEGGVLGRLGMTGGVGSSGGGRGTGGSGGGPRGRGGVGSPSSNLERKKKTRETKGLLDLTNGKGPTYRNFVVEK